MKTSDSTHKQKSVHFDLREIDESNKKERPLKLIRPNYLNEQGTEESVTETLEGSVPEIKIDDVEIVKPKVKEISYQEPINNSKPIKITVSPFTKISINTDINSIVYKNLSKAINRKRRSISNGNQCLKYMYNKYRNQTNVLKGCKIKYENHKSVKYLYNNENDSILDSKKKMNKKIISKPKKYISLVSDNKIHKIKNKIFKQNSNNKFQISNSAEHGSSVVNTPKMREENKQSNYKRKINTVKNSSCLTIKTPITPQLIEDMGEHCKLSNKESLSKTNLMEKQKKCTRMLTKVIKWEDCQYIVKGKGRSCKESDYGNHQSVTKCNQETKL